MDLKNDPSPPDVDGLFSPPTSFRGSLGNTVSQIDGAIFVLGNNERPELIGTGGGLFPD